MATFLTDIQTTALADKPDLLHLNKGGVDYAISVEDLQKGLTNEGVSTVADLATRESKAGEYVYTLGYHAAYDGGHGLYKIVPLADLNGTLDDVIHHTTTNNLVAELVTNGTINPRQAGAQATAGIDDAASFLAIKNQYGRKIRIVPAISSDIYRIRSKIICDAPIHMEGITVRRDYAVFSTMFKVTTKGCRFIDCEFDNGNLRSTINQSGEIVCNILLEGSNTSDTIIKGCSFHSFAGAASTSRGDDAILINELSHTYSSDNKEPIIIDGCTIRSPWRNGIAIINGENIEITNNYIYNSVQGGILLESGFTGSPGPYIKQILIKGNTLVDCGVQTPTDPLNGDVPYNNSSGQYGICVVPFKPEYTGTYRYDNITIEDNRVFVDADNMQDTSDLRHICYLIYASSCTNLRCHGNLAQVLNKTPTSEISRCWFGTESATSRGHNYSIKDNEFQVQTFATTNCERSLIQGNRFVDCDQIYFGTSRYSVVRDNTMYECPCPIELLMQDGQFKGNTIYSSVSNAHEAIKTLLAGQNMNLTIEGNIISGDYEKGISLNTNNAGSRSNNVRVVGNSIDGCTEGVFLQYFDDCHINGNTIKNATWGVKLESSNLCYVKDNAISYCGTSVFDVDHDRGDEGGGIYANFSDAVIVEDNNLIFVDGTPIFVKKCDPAFVIKGNSIIGSTSRPYTNELLDARYTGAIYIYRDGNANDIGWCQDNYYDQGSDVGPVVKVEDTPDTDGVTPDGSFYTGMFARQGTLNNNSQKTLPAENSKPRYHTLGTGETGGSDTADGHVKIEVDGVTYNVLTSSTAV